MKLDIYETPRRFSVNKIEIKDLGKIRLDDNEMISFVTQSGKEFDFTAKDWGFYVTPSINGRLKNQGFKTALVENEQGRIFLMAVEKEKMDLFDHYCKKENQKILHWLDEHENHSKEF